MTVYAVYGINGMSRNGYVLQGIYNSLDEAYEACDSFIDGYPATRDTIVYPLREDATGELMGNMGEDINILIQERDVLGA